MRRIVCPILAAFCLAATTTAPAQPPAPTPPPAAPAATAPGGADWSGFLFLLGEWAGESKDGKGEFSLQPDVNSQVLVRRNVNTGPGGKHEDLMVIYAQGGLRAVYFDSEGHVIHYLVTTGEKGATFTGEEGPGPRFRLTYEKIAGGAVNVVFAVAAPGTGEFKPHTEGVVHRK